MKLNAILDVLDESSKSNETMDQLLIDRLQRVKQLFVLSMQQRLSADECQRVTASYERLGSRHQARLLASAEFGEIVQLPIGNFTELTGGKDGITNIAWLNACESCIARESIIEKVIAEGGAINGLDDIDSTSGPIWSPLGDVYVLYEPAAQCWGVHVQPLLGEVIVLDFDSPVSHRTELRSGVLASPRMDLSHEEKLEVEKKLGKALELIDELVPIYGLLIRNFTRRVVIRKSPSVNGVYPISSEHVPRQPGGIRLLNPQFEKHSVEAVAEQLLHESVHNFLAAWEMANSYFFRSNDLYRPVSPWSGNLIPNPSLAHAVFVYYACHHLFDRHWERYRTRDSLISSRRNIFASGFLFDQDLCDLFLSDMCGTKDLFPALQQMQDKVRNIHAC